MFQVNIESLIQILKEREESHVGPFLSVRSLENLAYKILLEQVHCVAGTVRADTASFLSCTVVALHYF